MTKKENSVNSNWMCFLKTRFVTTKTEINQKQLESNKYSIIIYMLKATVVITKFG